MPLLDTARIAAAFQLAAEVHARQKRKGTEIPYIAHPMAVASRVLSLGGTEDQFIAALLHDVLEDGGVEYAGIIEAKFGSRVLELVKALSDALPKAGEMKRPWLERKTEYLGHLEKADAEVLLVSAADKWHNLSSIRDDQAALGDKVFERFIGSRHSLAEKKRLTLWYYKELDRIFEARNVPGAYAMHRILQEVLFRSAFDDIDAGKVPSPPNSPEEEMARRSREIEMREAAGIDFLSEEDFEALRKKLTAPITDPKEFEARERLMKAEFPWEK